MFCLKCGVELDDVLKTCTSCGLELHDIEQEFNNAAGSVNLGNRVGNSTVTLN
jgi:uncharacterized membrane protein YvbJ